MKLQIKCNGDEHQIEIKLFQLAWIIMIAWLLAYAFILIIVFVVVLVLAIIGLIFGI